MKNIFDWKIFFEKKIKNKKDPNLNWLVLYVFFGWSNWQFLSSSLTPNTNQVPKSAGNSLQRKI